MCAEPVDIIGDLKTRGVALRAAGVLDEYEKHDLKVQSEAESTNYLLHPASRRFLAQSFR